MGSCYLDVRIAGDHLRTDVRTCNIEEQRRTPLERSVINILLFCVGVGGRGRGEVVNGQHLLY